MNKNHGGHREHGEKTRRSQRTQHSQRYVVRRNLLFFWCIVSVFSVSSVVPCFGQKGKKPPVRRVTSPWDVEAREYLGTPQSEKAVEKGLAYLASVQDADGHWRSGNYRSEVAITGVALMAFLSAGHQPGRGKYGLVLDSATDFLAKSVRMDGNFVAPGLVRAGPGGGPPMYGHGFATLALAEVYGMTKRKDLKAKIQAAVNLIEETQSRQPEHDGGWRYQPQQGDADLSVTVVQVLALRGAKNAGLKVSQETIDRAMAYIKRCQNNRDGGFSYQTFTRQSGPARTGGGLLSLLMGNEKDAPEAQAGLKYLKEHPYNRQNEWSYREHFYYTIYYVTQASYQAGGEQWKTWYPAIRDILVRRQGADGSWSKNDGYAEAGTGPEYATAMSVLVLQVPAGLLPIYQK
jgi:hypothetical protein